VKRLESYERVELSAISYQPSGKPKLAKVSLARGVEQSTHLPDAQNVLGVLFLMADG